MAYEYAAKLICGTKREEGGFANGVYETLINIHNPHQERQEFGYKLALAGEAKDGKVYMPFKTSKIDTDAVQSFGCRTIRKIYDLVGPSMIEGFFVIRSKFPLDVIAVYTTNDENGRGVPSIEVERVFERRLPD